MQENQEAINAVRNQPVAQIEKLVAELSESYELHKLNQLDQFLREQVSKIDAVILLSQEVREEEERLSKDLSLDKVGHDDSEELIPLRKCEQRKHELCNVVIRVFGIGRVCVTDRFGKRTDIFGKILSRAYKEVESLKDELKPFENLEKHTKGLDRDGNIRRIEYRLKALRMFERIIKKFYKLRDVACDTLNFRTLVLEENLGRLYNEFVKPSILNLLESIKRKKGEQLLSPETATELAKAAMKTLDSLALDSAGL